jgi:molybdate transport repressor ModE-like protein
MNWDDLRLFLAVARTGSISGAARQLGVQHSTVSRRMRQLEAQLGARLIERMKSGYELTQAGEDIRDAAMRMESEVLGVDAAVLGRDAHLTGPLQVTAINNMASTVLMPMFASFSKAYPKIELRIVVSNVDASLAQREADVAIRLTDTPGETLVGKRVVTVASTIYGSREYIERVGERGGALRWIGVECCTFHKSWTKQACKGLPHNFYCDDTLLTLAALREGMGVSFLPCFMGDPDPLLARYCDPDPSHDLGLWILLHPDLKRTARVLAFRDHMIASIATARELFEGRCSR